jgi:hypothetical protein
MAAAPSLMLELLDAAVMVPSFLKAGFQGRDLVELDLARAFVDRDHRVASRDL